MAPHTFHCHQTFGPGSTLMSSVAYIQYDSFFSPSEHGHAFSGYIIRFSCDTIISNFKYGIAFVTI